MRPLLHDCRAFRPAMGREWGSPAAYNPPGISRAIVSRWASAPRGRSAHASSPASDQTWPAWRGPLGTGEATGESAHRVERDAQRPLEDRHTGHGRIDAGHLGRHDLPADGIAVGDEKAPRQTSFAFPEQMDVYKGLAYFRATRDYEFALVAGRSRQRRVRWRKVLRVEQPAEGRHPTNTYASASPSTDGEHIIAFFGSRGLYAPRHARRVVWERDFGEMQTRNGWGEGSSPTLFRDRVVVTWDHEGDSFIAALDKRTGRELWRRDRDEPTTWATPLVVPVGDRVHVITNGRHHVRGYDLETGADLWHGPGLTFNSIPSPAAANGVAYLTSGFEGSVLLAVDLAQGARRHRRPRRAAVAPRSRHAVRRVAAGLRRRDLRVQVAAGDPDVARRAHRRGALRPGAHRRAPGPLRVAGRRRRPHLRRRPRRQDRRLPARHPRSRRSPSTSSTTGSTRRRRSSAMSCTCEDARRCTASHGR